MKAYYDEKPSVISEVGNGSVLYRYGITEVEVWQGEWLPSTRKQYACQEIVVWLPVTSDKITEAVITDRWDSNYEQKLVNEYNSAKLGLLDKDAAARCIDAYTAYLRERIALKAQVDADCAALGIK